jgi:predicted AlkP superfamily phosphohydrolase/phosphomutase
LLRHGPFDLMGTVFAESHAGAHQFWPYFIGERNGGTELRSALRTIYSAIERELGALLRLMPEDTNVFVVSSVGIQQQYPIYHVMEDFCRKLGYQAAPPPGSASLKPMDVIRRLVPESWRIAVSRNFSRRTRERLLAGQFRGGTDWSRTAVFAIPSSFTGLLRVNLRGREPHGIVEPGPAYRKLLERVTSDLRQLVDPVTGEAAVERAVVTVETFGGDPPLFLPDVFVLWKPGRHFMERLEHPKVELTQRQPEFSRDTHHSSNGFVAAAGPDIGADGDRGDVPLLDLAPTFLSLLGAPIPELVTGSPLPGVARHV